MRRPGFSVMEALVSIAILAIALIPLYQLQRTLADASFRLDWSLERSSLKSSATAYLAALNPAEQPSGTVDFGAWSLAWSSTLLNEEAAPQGPSGFSNFALGLYRIEARVSAQQGEFLFTVDQVGWRLVRDPLAEFGVGPPSRF